ncbi:hypothetical protein SCA6_018423 [Theobroma cacao]
MIIATPIAVFLGLLVVIYYIRRRRRKLEDEVEERIENDQKNQGRSEDMDLAVFELGTIARATDSFSFLNKLGEGGFGPVYKGTLANGQEIAVKRLSKSSGQGLNEFKTEVKLIAKLQHRNLVRLLGCCIHGEEKMLVYEYMPNRSLDSFIFDPHENAYFYLTMSCSGYMAPEYAIDGLFSVKSDVFSFGILLLEIISGRKNRGFYHKNQSGNLIEHQHPEGRPSMSSVVLMLGSENELPLPKQPGFLFHKSPFEADSSSGNHGSSSKNEISLSVLEAR